MRRYLLRLRDSLCTSIAVFLGAISAALAAVFLMPPVGVYFWNSLIYSCCRAINRWKCCYISLNSLLIRSTSLLPKMREKCADWNLNSSKVVFMVTLISPAKKRGKKIATRTSYKRLLSWLWYNARFRKCIKQVWCRRSRQCTSGRKKPSSWFDICLNVRSFMWLVAFDRLITLVFIA